MRRLTIILAVLGTLVVAVESRAAILQNAISLDGIEDQIQDNSVGLTLLDNDSSGTVTVGDQVVGLIRLVTNTTDNIDIVTTLGEIAIVFGAEFTSGPNAPKALLGGLNFDNGPIAPGGPVNGITGTGGAIEELLSSFPAASFPNSADTVFAVLSSTTGSNPTAGTLSAALASFNDGLTWTLEMTGGFDPSGTNQHGDADFFNVEFLDFDGNGAISLLEFLGLSAGTQVGLEAGGFTVLSDPGLPAGTLFSAVSVSPLGVGLPTDHDVGLPSTALLRPNVTEVTNGWEFADQAVVRINATAIPEPTAILIWGIIAVASAGILARPFKKDV